MRLTLPVNSNHTDAEIAQIEKKIQHSLKVFMRYLWVFESDYKINIDSSYNNIKLAVAQRQVILVRADNKEYNII